MNWDAWRPSACGIIEYPMAGPTRYANSKQNILTVTFIHSLATFTDSIAQVRRWDDENSKATVRWHCQSLQVPDPNQLGTAGNGNSRAVL